MMDAMGSSREILFEAEQSPEGGYTARAIGVSIFTEAASLEALRGAVREAVACHFGDEKVPAVIRLRVVLEEILRP